MTAPPAGASGDAPGLSPRGLGALLLAAGLLGAGAALALAIEKFNLLENPLYVPACSINEAIDCASVMRSAQSQTFGFPNPFIGLAAFPALALLGVLLLTGGKISRPVWRLLQIGLTFAVVFVHYLAFQTLYDIGALCPFCIAVWLAVIPAFWYVTLHNARGLSRRRGLAGPLVRGAQANHAAVPTAWLLVLLALILERFWTP